MATIGVKLELNGAASYTEGMKQATSQVKLFDAQLKGLTSGMSNASSAFATHKQTTEALQGKLSALKDEQALLTQKLEEAKSKYGDNSTQANNLATKLEYLNQKISATEEDLKNQGGTLGAVGAQLKDWGGKLDAVGKKAQALGTTLATHVTAPILAVGAASVSAWKEVDESFDTIIAKTGATGTALEGLTKVAENIATSVPASFDEIGNAVGEVNTRFGLTGSSLQTLSTQFIEFAKLNGTDVSTSIDTVQSAMSAFGLSADQAGVFLDTLNKAGQDTGISVDELASSMTTNAAALKEMGYSASDSAMFIANLSKQGIDASTVMAGMKKALANAVAEGKPMDVAMSELQDTMANATTSTEAYQSAIELFGAKAGPAIAEACQSGRLSFEALGTSMSDFAGNVDSTFTATLDPLDQMQVHMNQLKLIGADIVNTMAPTLTKAMDGLSKVLKNLSDSWNNLSEDQKQMIIKIAGIVAAVGPVLLIVGKVISGIAGLIINLGAMTTAIGVLTPAVTGIIAALAPFAPLILGIIAAIVVIIATIKNWDKITNFFKQTWTAMTTAITTAFTNAKEGVTNKLNELKTKFTEGFNTMESKATDTFNNIKSTVTSKAGEMKDNVVNKISNMKDKFGEKFEDMKSKATSIFSDLKNSALTWGKDMIDNFINGVKQKIEDVKNAATNVAKTVKDILGFSEPKKGPLSNFHTYGPDMMKSYSKGIKDYSYLVRNAVDDVAVDVSNGFGLDSDSIYSAVRQGSEDANIGLSIGEREFTRVLRGLGVQFNA